MNCKCVYLRMVKPSTFIGHYMQDANSMWHTFLWSNTEIVISSYFSQLSGDNPPFDCVSANPRCVLFLCWLEIWCKFMFLCVCPSLRACDVAARKILIVPLPHRTCEYVNKLDFTSIDETIFWDWLQCTRKHSLSFYVMLNWSPNAPSRFEVGF